MILIYLCNFFIL